MGGQPQYYFVSLSVPAHTPRNFITELYRGMHFQAKRFQVMLLGGDTVASNHGMSVNVTLIGTAKKKNIVYRHGAKKGDLIYVSGSPGDSALGLRMIEKGQNGPSGNPLIRKHLDPEPRIDAGKAIAWSQTATSMIDISDGLVADLKHLLTSSHVGAEIYLPMLPLSAKYKKQCLDFFNEFYHPALCGGEDYELLFTVNPGNITHVKKIAKQTKTSLTCIGKITGRESRLLILDKNGKEVDVQENGYTHF